MKRDGSAKSSDRKYKTSWYKGSECEVKEGRIGRRVQVGEGLNEVRIGRETERERKYNKLEKDCCECQMF